MNPSLQAFLLAALFSVVPVAHGQACQPSTWVRLEGGVLRAEPSEVIADMARRDVVLLGESHEDADHHRWQLHTLAALHARRARMVIGFEAFPRSAQPVLDRWVRGELTLAQLAEQTNWREAWTFDVELYRPLFEFARINRVPMVALNVDRRLTRAVSQKGWDAVPEAQREGVSRPAPAPREYEDALFESFQSHGRTAEARRDAPAFRNFVAAQQTWDRAFAEALARHAGRGGDGTLAVGIIGSGHLRHGHGVALQLRDLGVPRVGTLIPLRAPSECEELKAGLAEAAFLVPTQPAAEPPRPRLGVRLEQQGARVRLAEVSAGSLAERAGLRPGDLIVAVAGKPLDTVETFIDAVRRQPEGTWLPLQVRRDEALQDIVVRFPPAR
jgi:uncharacterized iron-regulated protein